MFKKLLAFFAAMSLVAAFAAVDVNKATEAELDGIKGIGPATTKQIVSERKKGEFKNWDDFVTRVKGVGDKNAAKFSAEGLTVGGTSYQGPAVKAKADTKKTDKPATEKAKDTAVTTKDAAKDAAKDGKTAGTPKADAKVKAEAAKPAASAAVKK